MKDEGGATGGWRGRGYGVEVGITCLRVWLVAGGGRWRGGGGGAGFLAG